MCFIIHPAYEKALTKSVIEEIFDRRGNKTKVILGIELDNTLEQDEVFVTSIITGLEQKTRNENRKKDETGFKSIAIDIDDTFMNAILMIGSMLQLNRRLRGIKITTDDLSCVLAHKGTVLISCVHIRESVDALNSTLKKVEGARGVLINFQVCSTYSIALIKSVINKIDNSISSNTDLVLGITIDDTLDQDEVFITLIITGLEQK